ncbi:hypothetical protein F4803DRAFT_553185 [Xylaria telfairii]|nr:hypothetical protein F4803DRAFT_553185 [Xylaria telfairii]
MAKCAPPTLFYHQGRRHVTYDPEDTNYLVPIDAQTLMDIEQKIETCPPRPGPGVYFETMKAVISLLNDDRESLRKLRSDITTDFHRMWDQKIPFTPDLTKLRLVARGEAMYAGIGGHHFDFGIDTKDPTISWYELMDARERALDSEFDTLEAVSLRGLTPPLPPRRRLKVDPDPTIASKALRIIHECSTSFEPRIFRFLVEFGEAHIFSCPMARWSPLQCTADQRAFLALYRDTVCRTLRLADEGHKTGYTKYYCRNRIDRDLVDHAVLSVLFICARIPRLIKTPVDFSGFLWKIKYLTREDYISHVGYNNARNLRSCMKDRIKKLNDLERAKFYERIVNLVVGKW